jgi:hypothetical protein
VTGRGVGPKDVGIPRLSFPDLQGPPSLPLICERIQCRRFRQRIAACTGGGGCPYLSQREVHEELRAVEAERQKTLLATLSAG